MKLAGILITATICLSGFSFAVTDNSNNVAAAVTDTKNVIPNRNMPQKVELYVDFGINGFLYKKRNVPAIELLSSADTQQDVKKRYYARMRKNQKTPSAATTEETDSNSIVNKDKNNKA